MHYKKKILKLRLLLVRVGVKVIIVKVAFHCFGSIIFFFKFLFNKKNTIFECYSEENFIFLYYGLSFNRSWFVRKNRNVSNIFSSDNSSDEEDKKMPARDIAGSDDDNDNSVAAGSPNESNDIISAAPDSNMPVARYPSDIETEEISIKNSTKDNYLDYLATQFYDDDKKDECISSDNIDSRKRILLAALKAMTVIWK